MNLNFVIKKISTSLSKPYPLLIAERYCFLYVCILSFIIAILINIEQPFGLHAWIHPYKWLILSGFGVTYAVANIILYVLSPRLFPTFFCVYNWTVAKEIFIFVVLFLLAGVINWVHAFSTISYFEVSCDSFCRMQCCTFIFGCMPVITLSMFVQIKSMLRTRLPKEQTLEKKAIPQPAQLAAESFQLNGVEFIIRDIIYLHANQNYVEIYFLQSGKIEKRVCRTTIKLLETYLIAFPQFVRCHKSYMVNTQMIIRSKGNSGKMELTLKYCMEKVPVSRKFVPLIKEIVTAN